MKLENFETGWRVAKNQSFAKLTRSVQITLNFKKNDEALFETNETSLGYRLILSIMIWKRLLFAIFSNVYQTDTPLPLWSLS